MTQILNGTPTAEVLEHIDELIIAPSDSSGQADASPETPVTPPQPSNDKVGSPSAPITPPPTFENESANSQSEKPILSEVLDDYFHWEIRPKEHYPICLVGSGQSGSELAGTFRLQPEFVTAYTPEFYPVRAATFDTQSQMPALLGARLGWTDPGVQLHIQLPNRDQVSEILRRGAERRTNPSLARLLDVDQEGMFESGGAGGKSIKGRAAALLNLMEEGSWRAESNRQSLERARYFSRTNSGYLISFSSFGGGSGSGAAPVAVEYVHQKLEPKPTATYSVCVVPESQDSRLVINRLVAAFYMVTCPIIDGVILSDNLQLNDQGHKTFPEIDCYLQDVLMPIFLAIQPNYKFGIELDPANVCADLQPTQKKPEFIVACFSVCPMVGASERIQSMKAQSVSLEPGQKVPEFKDLLHKALANPTMQFEAGTGRRAIGLVSGPAWALQEMGFDEPAKVEDMRKKLFSCTIDPGFAKGAARIFAAQFPGMSEVRLTILISAPHIPTLEHDLTHAVNDPNWGRREGESLADAIRRLDESTVRQMALEDLGEH